MHEITPSLIAEIASRLYNEVPGSHIPPKTEADAGNFPQAHAPSGAPPIPTSPWQASSAQASAVPTNALQSNPQAHLPNVHTQPSLPSSGPSHSMGPLVNPNSPQHSPSEASPQSHSGSSHSAPTAYTTPQTNSLPSSQYPTTTNPSYTHLHHPQAGSSHEYSGSQEPIRGSVPSKPVAATQSAPASPNNYDGLAAFVSRIRNPQVPQPSASGVESVAAKPASPQHSPTELSPSSHSSPTVYTPPQTNSLPSSPYPSTTNPSFTHLHHPHVGSSREYPGTQEAIRGGVPSESAPVQPSSGPPHTIVPLVNPSAPQHSPSEVSPSSHSGPTMYTPPQANSLPSAPHPTTQYPTTANPSFTHLHHPHAGSGREPSGTQQPIRTGIPAESTSPSPSHQAPTSSNNYDGLAAFVKRIRNPHIPQEPGPGGESVVDPNQDILRRIFSQNSVPNGGSRPFDVAAIRADFPILHQRIHGKSLAWFDNAATTQKPQAVIDSISRFYAHDNSNIHRAAHTLAARSTDAYELARQKVQGFLGAASSKEIIFVRGTTEGINLVAKTYGAKYFQPGDEIVLSTLEHHANIVPWQMVAKQTGAVIRVVPVNDRGEIMLEDYQALLGPRTKFVSLTYASNSLGTILPVAEMTQLAKRYNARVLIDGAQSVAHIPTNVQQLGCDFFVFSGHKIFGPTGIGAVFAKQEVMEIMPPWQGGGAMIKNVTFEESTYNDPPTKFEAGTPNIADAVGLGAALDYVTRLGLPNIGRYEHELLEHGTERLSHINGLRIVGTARNKVSVLSFVLKDHRTEEVGKYLDQEGIAVRAGHHCSQPSLRRFGLETTVRPSFAFYNTKEEIDRMYEALKRLTRS